MNIELTEEAIEYGLLARRALESAGGDQLVQTAEQEPHLRGETARRVFAELGVWDLDPRSGSDDLEAAAALCRSVGYWAVPYPIAERLCRPADLGTDGLLVVAEVGPAAAVAGLDLRWTAVSMDGARSIATPRPSQAPPRKSAFVADLDLEPVDAEGARDLALGLVLPCWTLLGMLDRAVALTRSYVLDRQQFGQPLAAFQSVQFQMTDAEVERAGVEELAKYALWSVETGRQDAVEDALVLRLAAVEAAETVFRVAHQLHGAIGFCDETTLSWVSRYSIPLRRLPFALSGTRDQLTCRLGRRSLHGLFSGAIRTVVINRPEQLNAVNASLHMALASVWRQLSADREARVVILTGAGRTFCAGGDFDWISSFLTDEAGRYESLRQGAEIIDEMLRFPLPVIAAVNGAAVGLGCSIAVLCDVVLMSERAHLADPHVSVGLVAGDGGAAFWPLLTHIMKSREYLFTGDRISAGTAVELGLATRATAPDDLMPEARRLAERIAQQPPLAIQGTKRVINMHLSRALSGATQAGLAAEEVTMQTDEHRQRLLQLKPRPPQ